MIHPDIHRTVQYTDFGLMLSGGVIPEPPKPTILRRNDGHCLFYEGEVNWMYGKPESGKTWIALAAVLEVLAAGRRAAMLDLDHNTGRAIARRLLDLGMPMDVLRTEQRFRHTEPEDRDGIMATLKDLREWKPQLVVVDSIGVLMPMMGLSSNLPDDFTLASNELQKLTLDDGACVLALDHVSKGPGASGPTGTAAKSRTPGGAMFEVTVDEPFVTGRGGSAKLRIDKDRHSGVRRVSATAPQLAATFQLNPAGAETPYSIYKPNTGVRRAAAPPMETDLEMLRKLSPPPTDVRDIKARMHWGSERAADVWQQYRESVNSREP